MITSSPHLYRVGGLSDFDLSIILLLALLEMALALLRIAWII